MDRCLGEDCAMSYFSRLTDIVTCNLTELLAREADPAAALEGIIAEMQEGLSGAKRSVAAAQTNADRLEQELAEHRRQIAHWTDQARQELQAGREDGARVALVRKQEVDDLIAGLEQQFQAAGATRQHLTTTLHALEARLADALRRQRELRTGAAPAGDAGRPPQEEPAIVASRAARIDAELAALKREMGHGV
jgi:phage shock protein A